MGSGSYNQDDGTTAQLHLLDRQSFKDRWPARHRRRVRKQEETHDNRSSTETHEPGERLHTAAAALIGWADGVLEDLDGSHAWAQRKRTIRGHRRRNRIPSHESTDSAETSSSSARAPLQLDRLAEEQPDDFLARLAKVESLEPKPKIDRCLVSLY